MEYVFDAEEEDGSDLCVAGLREVGEERGEEGNQLDWEGGGRRSLIRVSRSCCIPPILLLICSLRKISELSGEAARGENGESGA